MQLEKNTLASHPFDSMKRSKFQELRRKPKSKPILLAWWPFTQCHHLSISRRIPSDSQKQSYPSHGSDSQLIPKKLLTYNMGATKIDELEETSSVCSTKGEVINDGTETKSKARVSKMAKVWPALLD